MEEVNSDDEQHFMDDVVEERGDCRESGKM